MKYGLYSMNFGTCADPEVAVRVAQHAEAAGFESLWVGEHVVLPNPKPDWFGMPHTLAFLDPVVSMTLLATNTSRVTVGSGILELPLHQPIRLAKQFASLDRVAPGRIELGVGAGYLEAEFAAMGVDLAERARRTDEYIDSVRVLWSMADPSFSGTHVSFSGVDAYPRPVTVGGPPILIGGNSVSARRRAVQRGNGWFPYDTTPEQVAALLPVLAEEIERLERPDALGRLELTIIPAAPFDRSAADEYEALGVDRIVLLPNPDAPADRPHDPVPVDQILATIDRLAAALGMQPS